MMVVLILLIGALVATVSVMMGLRRYVLGEGATEALLRRPETHALRYTVPRGQDPAIVTTALVRAGYKSVGDFEGGTARVLIACDEHDRGKVSDTDHRNYPLY